MLSWTDFVEAGFNRAFNELTKQFSEGFMSVKEKIAELQLVASEERQQVKVRFEKFEGEIKSLKELLTGNDTLVADLLAKLAEKDAKIGDLETQLNASKNEIQESIGAIDGVIAEVKEIVSDEPVPAPIPLPVPDAA